MFARWSHQSTTVPRARGGKVYYPRLPSLAGFSTLTSTQLFNTVYWMTCIRLHSSARFFGWPDPTSSKSGKETETINAWQVPACSPLGTNAPAKLRGYWNKVRQILPDLGESSAVLTRASMLRSSRPLWNSAHRIEMGYAISRQKSVTTAMSFERSRKEGRIDHAQPYTYLFWKPGEDRSSTYWDNWSLRIIKRKRRWKKVT